MDRAALRAVALRVAALTLLLALTLVAVLTMRTLQRLPDAQIYLVRSDATGFELAPVSRQLGTRNAVDYATAAVRALVQGPTASELREGLSSELPPGTTVRTADLDADGTLTVDLDEAFRSGGGSASMRGRLEQLRWTLTRPTSVRALELHVAGERLWLLGGEGLIVEPRWSPPGDGRLPRW
ncbi:MAG: GerMN domain-containing protein [Trueperaceae bacterium]